MNLKYTDEEQLVIIREAGSGKNATNRNGPQLMKAIMS